MRYLSSPRRMMRYLVLVIVALLVPVVAQAHGRLKSAFPADGAHLSRVPRILRLDFSESPDLAFSSVRLTGPDGRAVLLGAMGYAVDTKRRLVVPIAGTISAGTYTIAWQMAGDDGHPVRGQLQFVVAPGAMDAGIPPSGIAPTTPTTGAPSDTATIAISSPTNWSQRMST